VYGKFKSESLIERGLFTKQQVYCHLAGFLVCIFVPCFLFWLIQQSGSAIETPMFDEWPYPQKFQAIGLLLACWSALGAWVFFYNGATTLGKTLLLITTGSESYLSQRAIKIIVALIIGSGVTSLIT
jgi:hypothetical protein